LIVLVRSDRVQMKLIYWEAILLLAKVHLQSGRAKQAKRAIESIYPQVLSGSSLLLESRAHFAYAKACMAADDDEANDGSKRDSIRKSTLDLLDRAASGFQRMFCLKELAAVLSMQLQILGQQQQSKQSHSQINSNSDEAIIAQRLATTEKQLLVNHCKIDSDWETIINVD
jgi:hypothetical protein